MGRIIPYIMENKPNLWNHQPVYVYIYSSYMLMAMLYIYVEWQCYNLKNYS
jgi:hypothetical protein